MSIASVLQPLRFFFFTLRCIHGLWSVLCIRFLLMAVTWLTEASSAQVRAFRAAWLLALFAGLVQKPRVALAWDVLVTLKAMRSLSSANAAPMVMGTTLILLRQIYAEKGQQLVATMACRLARGKRDWDQAALVLLATELESMERENTMRLKGRMAAHTGPKWIRKLLACRSHLVAFHRAGRYLGLLMSALVVTGRNCWIPRQSFGDCYEFLVSPDGKMPGISVYGVVGLLRALSCVRVDMGLPALSLRESDWILYVRDMTADTTKVSFQMAGVVALADAERMVAVIKAVARAYFGFRKAAEWGALNVLDLSCQACEVMQVLRSVQSSLPGIHGHGASVRWVIDTLPRDSAGMRALSKTLHLRRQKVHGRGNGKDLQSGTYVTLDWLSLCSTQSASDTCSAVSFASGGGGAVAGFLEQFLPSTQCELCGAALEPPFRSCASCLQKKRKTYDDARNHMRIYRAGQRSRPRPVKKRRRMSSR